MTIRDPLSIPESVVAAPKFPTRRHRHFHCHGRIHCCERSRISQLLWLSCAPLANTFYIGKQSDHAILLYQPCHTDTTAAICLLHATPQSSWSRAVSKISHLLDQRARVNEENCGAGNLSLKLLLMSNYAQPLATQVIKPQS